MWVAKEVKGRRTVQLSKEWRAHGNENKLQVIEGCRIMGCWAHRRCEGDIEDAKMG